MPTYNFTKRVRNVDETQYTPVVTVPSGLSTLQVTVLLDPADMLNPSTLFRYGFDWAPVGVDEWGLLARGTYIGDPANDISLNPFIKIGSFSSLAGKRVRGWLLSHTQISIGATVEIN